MILALALLGMVLGSVEASLRRQQYIFGNYNFSLMRIVFSQSITQNYLV